MQHILHALDGYREWCVFEDQLVYTSCTFLVITCTVCYISQLYSDDGTIFDAAYIDCRLDFGMHLMFSKSLVVLLWFDDTF